MNRRRVIGRRTLLRSIAGGAVALSGLSLLAACGGDDDDDSAGAGTTGSSITDTEATESETVAESATETSASTPGVSVTETEASSVDSTKQATETTSATAAETESSSEGEWTFTDDRGETITLPKRPERVVAYISVAAALWDFGIRPVGVYGTLRKEDGTPEAYAGEVDLDAVVSLGEVYGELDMEALVELQPDLIIYDIYWPDIDIWGIPPDAIEQVRSIAPIAGISYVSKPITDTISRLEELAGLLGADLQAPNVVEHRERFSKLSTDLETAITDKPGLKTMFASGWTDNLYIANPTFWSDLIYFKELGLDIVEPPVPADELWETLSWEQASKYQVDLILHDARSSALPPEKLAEIPSWTSQPAVQASQVGKWYTEFVVSYRGFSIVLEDLAKTLSESKADIV